MSRVLIAGGGTAGHVVPALALADVLTARGHQVAFCGTERGMEKDLVPRAGYPFSLVRIRGFQRKLGLSTLRTVGSIPLAGVDAWKVLRAFKPDVVVGVGAYASGPVVAEAAVRGIPAVAVEMDAHMGVTNRILSRLVDKVCVSFPRPGADPRKFVYTGRPLRPAMLAATRAEGLARFHLDGSRQVLLVFGGSLGARTLNRAATGAYAQVQTPFQILHVTGEREYPAVAELLQEWHELAAILGREDLARVGRANGRHEIGVLDRPDESAAGAGQAVLAREGFIVGARVTEVVNGEQARGDRPGMIVSAEARGEEAGVPVVQVDRLGQPWFAGLSLHPVSICRGQEAIGESEKAIGVVGVAVDLLAAEGRLVLD